MRSSTPALSLRPALTIEVGTDMALRSLRAERIERTGFVARGLIGGGIEDAAAVGLTRRRADHRVGEAGDRLIGLLDVGGGRPAILNRLHRAAGHERVEDVRVLFR